MGATRRGMYVGGAVVTLAVLLAVQLYMVGTQGAGSLFDGVPQLAAQLGVSTAVATKLLDFVNSWYLAVLLAAATGGWGAALVRFAAYLATRYGKVAAAAW